MAHSVPDRGPVAATAEERPAIGQIDRLFARSPDGVSKIVGTGGEAIDLPMSVIRVLRQAVRAMAEDHMVTVVPVQKRLTTQQAADLLNVSRPYLIRLLEEDKIPFEKVGSHRRVRADDLLAYKRRRDAERDAALDELTRISQAMGLYDDL